MNRRRGGWLVWLEPKEESAEGATCFQEIVKYGQDRKRSRRSKMKKLFARVLVLFFLAFFLTSCGKGTASSLTAFPPA